MVGIYEIKNKLTGRVYIGQSMNIKRRWRAHRNSSKTEDSRLYQDIREIGIDNFEFKVIEECLKEDLNQLEISYIEDSKNSKYGSYNINSRLFTGTMGYTLDEDKVKEIRNLLVDAYSSEYIAEMYGVSMNTISSINWGETWYEDHITYPIRDWFEKTEVSCVDCGTSVDYKATRCRNCHNLSIRVVDRPSSEDLLRSLKDTNFERVGEYYGVTGNTIRKWCESYDMPTKASYYKPAIEEIPRELTSEQFNPDDIFPATFIRDGESLEFNNRKEMVNYIINKNISTGTDLAITKGIGRYLSGKRKSYLGFTLKNEINA